MIYNNVHRAHSRGTSKVHQRPTSHRRILARNSGEVTAEDLLSNILYLNFIFSLMFTNRNGEFEIFT